uniref:Cytochrome b n=1 Tax=Exallonyx sp. ZJUH_2016014 TaxID=2491158 RepID=A0A3S8V0R8_9HYME|nr:cytochrome b [Exallonyx sp. ZJUH_2016014]
MENYKPNFLMKIINYMKLELLMLPTPININIWWNFGSLLGLCLMIQFITGLFLTMHYIPNINLAFNYIIHIHQDVYFGWLIRMLHMNGASFFFICLFIHIGRGIYYNSYSLKMTWFLGIIIFLTTMTTAFLGYVLPWGQMSFWGATVITNLMTSIPYIGNMITNWIWGGYSIDNPTLNRFYTFHFLFPFLIILFIFMHLMALHSTGSNNPIGTNSNLNKIPFHQYFSWKDLLGFQMLILSLFLMCMINPFLLSDPDNFIPANPFITPIHIQPEWYFLFAYTILRATPNKLGGVIALLSSILILSIMPILKLNNMKSLKFYPLTQITFWVFINCFIILTWLGANPIESPFILMSQIISMLYFMFYFINPITMYLWDKNLF